MSMSKDRIYFDQIHVLPMLNSVMEHINTSLKIGYIGYLKVEPSEHFCTKGNMLTNDNPDEITIFSFEDVSPTAIIFTGLHKKGTDFELDTLQEVLHNGLSGSLKAIQNAYSNKLKVQVRKISRDTWEDLDTSKFFFCSRWILSRGKKEVNLDIAIPAEIVFMLYDNLFRYEQFVPAYPETVGEFAKILLNNEKLILKEHVDGIPGLDYQPVVVFKGGQCAETRWYYHFHHLLRMGKNDLQLFFHQVQEQGLIEQFKACCSGCVETAKYALSSIITERGVKEILDDISDIPTSIENETLILAIAQDLFESGRIAPHTIIKNLMEKTQNANKPSIIFDYKQATSDFIRVFKSLSKPDIQYAVANLPEKLMATALLMESNHELVSLYGLIKENSTRSRWDTITSTIHKVSKDVGTGSARNDIVITARLECIDEIAKLCDDKRISDTFHEKDPHWVSDKLMKEVLEKAIV